MALSGTEGNAPLTVLAIDTSSQSGSVALCRGGQVIAESAINVRSTHSERLLVQIEQVLDASQRSLSDMDLLAVSRGPGSFTGLRVGLATAQGLAVSAGLPLIGVSTLQALALNLPLSPVPVCTFLDARKQEVYSCLYDTRSGFPRALGDEQVLPPELLLDRLEQEVVFAGDGVAHYRDLIVKRLGADVCSLPPAAHQVRASSVAFLAEQSFVRGDRGSSGVVSPCYIRPPDADLPQKKG